MEKRYLQLVKQISLDANELFLRIFDYNFSLGFQDKNK